MAVIFFGVTHCPAYGYDTIDYYASTTATNSADM